MQPILVAFANADDAEHARAVFAQARLANPIVVAANGAFLTTCGERVST
jgi:hypothetical protein